MGTHEMVIEHLFETTRAMIEVDGLDVVRAVELLAGVRERKAFVWLVGNGGSAATASHFANDLEKMCGIRAVSIPDLAPMVLAYGNDEGWHKMFSRALDGYGTPQDVVIVFSCSGYSGNVVEVAKEWAGEMIIFTGDDQDSKLVQEASAEVVIYVHHPDIMVQENVHLALCHAIVDALREKN